MNERKLHKNLAFVDNSFHKKTKSTNFLRNILRKKYKIKNFWQYDYNINDLATFEYIFFCQSFISFRDLLRLKKSKIIWCPMYDSLSNFDPKIWKICSILNIKILSFSEEVNKLCKKNKVKYLYCKFFFKPKKKIINKSKKLKIFFWYRGQIQLKEWIKYFNLSEISKIYYYDLVDPFYKKEIFNKSELKKYKLQFIKGGFAKNNSIYLKKVKESDVFVAPRKKEGIGMSFLEALSFSNYVIAYNQSTMNEYLSNSKLGFLFDEKTKKKIILRNIKNFSNFRYKFLKNEYLKWISSKYKIENIYRKENNIYNINKNLYFYILYIQNYYFDLMMKIKKKIYRVIQK